MPKNLFDLFFWKIIQKVPKFGLRLLLFFFYFHDQIREMMMMMMLMMMMSCFCGMVD